MKMPSINSGENFAPYPEGTHAGSIVWLCDIGMHDKTFQGHTSSQHQLLIGYSSPDVLKDTGEQWVRTERVKFSAHPKSRFRKLITQVLGKSMTDEQAEKFDPESLVGMPILFQVVHNESSDGRIWANIGSVMPASKLSKKDLEAIAKQDTLIINVGDDLGAAPEWLGDLCLTGWAALERDEADEEADDDIPF